MANICLLIVGGITSFVGIIIILISSSIHSQNQNIISELEKELGSRIITDKNQFDKLMDGDVVYITGEYEQENAFDKDFRVTINGQTIIKRQVEQLREYNTRLLYEKSEESMLADKFEANSKVSDNPSTEKNKRCKINI